MRHAISFSLVSIAALTTGVFFLACSADDKGDPGGGRSSGRDGGGIDLDSLFKSSDSGSTDGSGGQGGQGGQDDPADASEAGKSDAATAPKCESCGSAESAKACGAKLAACRANNGCKRIYDCIYSYRGCGLTSSDIGCIQGCFDDYCDDEKSVSLYLDYDQCTYCSPACADACGSYCSSFPDGGLVTSRCSGGSADAGPKDADISDGAGGSGGSDASDGSLDGGDPDDPPPLCVPGRQEACACVGGAEGAQICNSNGTGYGPCACPKPDAGSAGSGGSGGRGGSGGEGGSEPDEHEEEEDDDD